MAPKRKLRPPPINYSSFETAAAASLDSEQWLQDGVQQESQGDRYQHGAKAARHYHNAIVSYRLAASRSTSPAFDPVYNAARVMFTLTSDHLEASDCVDMMQRAIATFRMAQTAATSTDEVIDSSFNLAQALVALQDLYDDGISIFSSPSKASSSAATGSDHARLLAAKRIFSEVEQLQRSALDPIFREGSTDTPLEVDMQDATAADPGSIHTAAATEGRIVVPRQVIDTLLEAIELDLRLLDLVSTSDPTTSATLAESAVSALSRAAELSRFGPSSSSSAELELVLAQISVNTSCRGAVPTNHALYLAPEQVLSTINALASSRQDDPSLLCAAADHLLENSAPSAGSIPRLEFIVTTYQRAHALLSSRLSPPKDVPAHRIPSLVASNLVSQVETLLLLFHLSPPERSSAYLHRARDQAIEAIKASSFGYTVELAPTVRILKLPGDGRRDWTTVKAFRQGWFWLVRVLVHAASGPAGSNGWMGLLRAWDKVALPTECTPGWMSQLRWYLDVQEWPSDRVWEASHGKEQEQWAKVLMG
ncbi:BQ5605_C010g05837 [Microbotryum silenes-dioicae]|uniref:BQ5605_C010g05837 protein n=1 Tax=Microbotryum silenes-dioicae TaxID=796604 RepID=A0A2X0LU70_9BASI|nr:BQ5605_C010g05837 [Microbotryum silenes-dioicae]